MNNEEANQAVAIAENASTELKGLDAKRWLDQIERRHRELQEAFDWLLDRGLDDDAMRMAVALYDIWRVTGRAAEGRSWIDRALPGVASGILKAEAEYRLALLAFWQGDDEAARSSLESSLGTARSTNDPTAISVALAGLARVNLRLGNLEEARRLCLEALETVEGTDDKEGRQNALHVLAVTAQMRGDLLEARDRMGQRLELAREVGNFAGVGVEASNLSGVERRLGNLARAQELAVEALQIADRRGDEWMIPYVLNALAACAAEEKKFVRAARLLGAAAEMVDRQGVAWPPDERPLFEQTSAAAAAALGPMEFDQALASGRLMEVSDAVSYGLSVDAVADALIAPTEAGKLVDAK